MAEVLKSPDFPEYLEKVTEVWDRIASWWDDQIGDAGFVLQGAKDNALGRRRALTNENQTGNAHALAVTGMS